MKENRNEDKIKVKNPVRVENGVVKEIATIHIDYPESQYDGRQTKWYEDKMKTEEGDESYVQK